MSEVKSDPERLASLEAMIVELQSQMAFQEDTIQVLNNIVAAQQSELTTLSKHINDQALQIRQLSSSPIDNSASQKPPHY